MKAMFSLALPALFLFAGAAVAAEAPSQDPSGDRSPPEEIGRLTGGEKVLAVEFERGSWGLRIEGEGLSRASQPFPVRIERWIEGEDALEITAGYSSIRKSPQHLLGKASVKAGDSRIDVEDSWSIAGGVLGIARSLSVSGSSPGGFLSSVQIVLERDLRWSDVDWFAPGMIYGGPANLSEAAIGGSGNFRGDSWQMRIREDRLPAPLFGIRCGDGSSLAVLDPAPDGSTTREDSRDTEAVPLTDERFRFGAIGARGQGGKILAGFWFPGTEGEVTYRGNTYPGGQMRRWRRRYHPLKDGLSQRYRVQFRFGREETFPEFFRSSWRWAWETLRPAAAPQDIEAARRCLADMLADRVATRDDRTGIPIFFDATKGGEAMDKNVILGFCGKNLEAVRFLLREAEGDPGPRGERLRKLGEAIAETFIRRKMWPPEGEGFHLETGKPVCPIGGVVYLRSLSDDFKAFALAIERERKLGRERREWLDWCRRSADWLLAQQTARGSFPRSWKPGAGEVGDPSPRSSYNPIPFLVALSRLTGERRHIEAAARAGEFAWAGGQSSGRFAGGTIDNPDVLDKEAGTLSLEAYLALFEATREKRWLERAAAAASYAETWIYLWNVPLPEDEDGAALHWKRGVPTTGLQLISTGHSLVDAYMAFDADEYAALFRLTGDRHFLDVARILLHGTKGMLALPGRTFDLAGPGWQQEHWSLAPMRGFGLHRGWLPWVATSQLNGILGLLDGDPEIYRALTAPR